ncbi:MAG: polyprenyl synthetase family protein [Actinomycetaceae bacterium]|nr:polyprenyl synthetase family protein [Actinomycetaceae bacterium]
MDKVESLLLDNVVLDDLQIDSTLLHLAKAGGKRIRPLLVLLTSELGATPESQDVYDAAVLVELTHLASLYHDDVMDDAPSRRGVPSVHKEYSNIVAILAGDIIFARASHIGASLGEEMVLLHADTFTRLCQGQLHETMGRTAGQSSFEHYISVLSDKTGSLISAAARSGVICSGGTPEHAEAVGQWAERIGVAFQLSDDVIDIFASAETSGKTPGTDLREGVDTMPIIFLRQQAEKGTIDEQGQEILDLLAGGLNTDADVEKVIALLRQHAVVQQTLDLAHQWVDEAESFLNALPDGDVKETMKNLGRELVDRSC